MKVNAWTIQVYEPEDGSYTDHYTFPMMDMLPIDKNNNLSITRDYLLPKLISGKVDVSDLDIDTSILDD